MLHNVAYTLHYYVGLDLATERLDNREQEMIIVYCVFLRYH